MPSNTQSGHVKRGPFSVQLLALTLPYFNSEERWSARGLLAATVMLNLATVVFAVLYNDWYRLFYNALQERSEPQFWEQLLHFAGIALGSVVCVAYRVYLVQILEMRWRRWLTDDFVERWLGNRVYYWMEMSKETDNPDQRICEDLKHFVDGLIGLGLGFLNALATLVSFLVILWTLSGSLSMVLWGRQITVPGYMVWAALVYAIGGSLLTHRIGRPLIGLSTIQAGFEADLRFRLQRLRENAEGVALYAGERSEQITLSRQLVDITGNWNMLARAQKRLNWASSSYVQIGLIFPFLTAAHRFFTGGINLGGLIQITDSFEKLRAALSWFIDNYATIANWRACVDRLLAFQGNLDAVLEGQDGLAGIHLQDAGCDIQLQGCELALPDGRVVLRRVDFIVKPGDRIMVSGPSGSGKSTLFRAIAGIWPFGRGSILRPEHAQILFLPQKPYLPIASLREVVAYPSEAAAFTDAAMVEILQLCRLPELVSRLAEVQHWAQQLSPGEQQRLAFARALLHKPEWLFLDEATSALDEDTEHEMYRLLHEHLQGTAIVSIAHRLAVQKYHDRRLDLEASTPAALNALAA
jgi:putative ATP-binding cassette transporter